MDQVAASVALVAAAVTAARPSVKDPTILAIDTPPVGVSKVIELTPGQWLASKNLAVDTFMHHVAGLNATTTTGFLNYFHGARRLNKELEPITNPYCDNFLVRFLVPDYQVTPAKRKHGKKTWQSGISESAKNAVVETLKAAGITPSGPTRFVQGLIEAKNIPSTIDKDSLCYATDPTQVAKTYYWQSVKVACSNTALQSVLEFVRSGALAEKKAWVRDIDITKDCRGVFLKDEAIHEMVKSGNFMKSGDAYLAGTWRDSLLRAACIILNDTKVGKYCLTWRQMSKTKEGEFDTRNKGYNKLVFMLEKGVSSMPWGSNIAELLKQVRSRLDRAKENTVAHGFTRIEISIYFDDCRKYDPRTAHLSVPEHVETCDGLLNEAAGSIPKKCVLQCPHRTLIRNWVMNQTETLLVVDSIEDKAFLCWGYNELTGSAAGNFINNWSSMAKHTLMCNTLANLPTRVITIHRDKTAAALVEEEATVEMNVDPDNANYRYAGAVEEFGEASEDEGGDDEGSVPIATSTDQEAPEASSVEDGSGEKEEEEEEEDSDSEGAPQKRTRDGLKRWNAGAFQISKQFDYNPFRLNVPEGHIKFTQELFYRVPTMLTSRATSLAEITIPTYFFQVGAQRSVFTIRQGHFDTYKERALDLAVGMDDVPELPTEPGPSLPDAPKLITQIPASYGSLEHDTTQPSATKKRSKSPSSSARKAVEKDSMGEQSGPMMKFLKAKTSSPAVAEAAVEAAVVGPSEPTAVVPMDLEQATAEPEPEVTATTLFGSFVMDPNTFFHSITGQGCTLIRVATVKDSKAASRQLLKFASGELMLTGRQLVLVLVDTTATYQSPVALLFHPPNRTFAYLQTLFDPKIHQLLDSNERIAKVTVPEGFGGCWRNFASPQKLRTGERGADKAAVSYLQNLHYWLHKLFEKPESFWNAPQDAFQSKKRAKRPTQEAPQPSADAPHVHPDDILLMQKQFSGFEQGEFFEVELFWSLPQPNGAAGHTVTEKVLKSMHCGVVRGTTEVPLSLMRRREDELYKFTIMPDLKPNEPHFYKAATFVRAEMATALEACKLERAAILRDTDATAKQLQFMSELRDCFTKHHVSNMDSLQPNTYLIVAMQQNMSTTGDGSPSFVAFLQEHSDTPIFPVNLRAVVCSGIATHDSVLEPLRKKNGGYTFMFSDSIGEAIGKVDVEDSKRNKLTVTISDHEVYAWGMEPELYASTSLVAAGDRALPGPNHLTMINYTDATAEEKKGMTREHQFLSQIADLISLEEGSIHSITDFGFAKFRGLRLYVKLGDRGYFWLPMDTASYRSDDSHELIPKEGETRKASQPPEYWTNTFSEPMMLRIVKVIHKKTKTPAGDVNVPHAYTAALVRPGDWHLHYHADALAKMTGRILDKGKRGQAAETSFTSAGIRLVHEQELSTTGKARKSDAVKKALIKSQDTGTVFLIRDIRHATELASTPGHTFDVLQWRMA